MESTVLRSLREIMAAAADENSDDEVSCGSADAITSTNPLDAYDLWHPKARDDCVICMQTLPLDESKGVVYNGCCGKFMCGGCMQAARRVLFQTNQKRKDQGQPQLPALCPYCREAVPVGEAAMMRQWEARMELGDAVAYYQVGTAFLNGTTGKPKKANEAVKLLSRSAEMGFPEACLRMAAFHELGHGGIVPKDLAIAKKYYQLAAKGGNVVGRHLLASLEINTTLNIHLAIKHLKIAAENGYKESMDALILLKGRGVVSKEEFNETARAYNNAVAEMKSENRDNFSAMQDLQGVLDGLDAMETKRQAKSAPKNKKKKKGGKKGKKSGKKKNRKYDREEQIDPTLVPTGVTFHGELVRGNRHLQGPCAQTRARRVVAAVGLLVLLLVPTGVTFLVAAVQLLVGVTFLVAAVGLLVLLLGVDLFYSV